MDLKWSESGLIPAIVQHAVTGNVLMLGWMNDEALTKTVETGSVHFFSRSRNQLWKKGETSGNTLALSELRTDCDKDAILVLATPNGPTCHTGTTSCFFRNVAGQEIDDGPPGSILAKLETELLGRTTSQAGKSYTKSLLDAGIGKINEKIVEEQRELVAELSGGTDERVASEGADLLFHVMVGFVKRDISFSRVLSVLAARFGKSGHDEKRER